MNTQELREQLNFRIGQLFFMVEAELKLLEKSIEQYIGESIGDTADSVHDVCHKGTAREIGYIDAAVHELKRKKAQSQFKVEGNISLLGAKHDPKEVAKAIKEATERLDDKRKSEKHSDNIMDALKGYGKK